jgi:hypothetical protein
MCFSKSQDKTIRRYQNSWNKDQMCFSKSQDKTVYDNFNDKASIGKSENFEFNAVIMVMWVISWSFLFYCAVRITYVLCTVHMLIIIYNPRIFES